MDYTDYKLQEFKDKFDELCNDNIASALKELRRWKYIALALILFVTIILFFYVYRHSFQTRAIEFFVIFVFIFSQIILFILGFFQKQIKKECLKNIIGAFEDLKFLNNSSQTNNILRDSVIQSGLISHFNDIENYSCYEGNFNGINFKVFETKLFYSTKKSRGKIFQGAFFEFDLKKAINNRIMIFSKQALLSESTRVFVLGSLISVPFVLLILVCTFGMHVNIASGDFQRQFGFLFWLIALIAVHCIAEYVIIGDSANRAKALKTPIGKNFYLSSDDKTGAFMIITSAFIEILENFQKVFRSKNIKCVIINKKIYIAIQTKHNLFEIDKFFNFFKDENLVNEIFYIFSSIYLATEHFSKLLSED